MVTPHPEFTVTEPERGVFIATCRRCGKVIVKHTRTEIELEIAAHIRVCPSR